MAGIRKILEAVCRHHNRENSEFAVRAVLLATTINLSTLKRFGPFNTAKMRFGIAGQDWVQKCGNPSKEERTSWNPQWTACCSS